MTTALIVGGTAATGLPIIDELQRRGYEVTVYHRGQHEVPGLADLEHIHGDPHFAEIIAADLGGRRWDLVVATYGRIRLLAEALIGKTERLITVGGTPVVRRLPGVPGLESDGYVDPGTSLIDRMIETEQTVLRAHAAGHYVSTVVRYPYVYGPHSVLVPEWHVVKRVHDDRRRWLAPGGGLGISTRCAAPNAAHTIGLAIDRPEIAGGQIYQVADDRQFTFREWTQMIARLLGYDFDFVDIPWSALPTPSTGGMFGGGGSLSALPQGGGPRSHNLLSNLKAKTELGYTDVVTPEAWMRLTLDHLLAHPPVIDGVGNHLKPEEFNYAAEDRLLGWWDGVLASAPSDVGAVVTQRHAYDHPQRPAEQREG